MLYKNFDNNNDMQFGGMVNHNQDSSDLGYNNFCSDNKLTIYSGAINNSNIDNNINKMSSCDTIKPHVILSDILEQNNIENIDENEKQTEELEENQSMKSPNKWYNDNEQTEPLNLTVNGTINNENFDTNSSLNNNNNNNDCDDVIFVKKYKVTNSNSPKPVLRKRRLKKIIEKNSLRRNPVRQARSAKRFQEYTNPNFSEDDFVIDSEDEAAPSIIQTDTTNEDSEDWTIRNNTTNNKKSKIKRVIKKKFIPKLGRKRKFTKTDDNENVNIEELETLIESNFIEMKTFISNVNILHSIDKITDKDLELQTRKSRVIDLIKTQALLLALIKDVKDVELLPLLMDS